VAPVNAVDPDLRKFFARGGKLLLVGGWNDAAVPPKVAVDYYKKVVAKVGEKTVQQSMRFFMAPGMAHGSGTTGAENFNYDPLTIIEQWKQTGKAPEQLIFGHYKNEMEVGKRLVCPYPQIAMYKGRATRRIPRALPASRAMLSPMFPLDRWYVAGFSWEFQDQPLARVLLNQPVVLFRAGGVMAALEDRCCHRHLSLFSWNDRRLRNSLRLSRPAVCARLADASKFPASCRFLQWRACALIRSRNENHIVWIWMGRTAESQPDYCRLPNIAGTMIRSINSRATFITTTRHTSWFMTICSISAMSATSTARTIGGERESLTVSRHEGRRRSDWVHVVRHLPNSEPPPTYVGGVAVCRKD
jgi:hypothetical protein